ncbi:hypothetical protein [Thermomonospora cellulosilytica]|uniref:Uncharacterized protein n=1 Tax=Thermomonospora cellulosilytica TaxID=1411118 RepID=A0A7W3N439_9ACTN|nr:hypothetical protein [Thermomonospora cellulosilytica]MBA9007208.1 hypothetical protein [Thermomonospora cellulosilytica]
MDAVAPARPVALFLLGYAWNLCFVAALTTLTQLRPRRDLRTDR